MKFHVIEQNGHRREASPLEYLEAPMCKRQKFMEAIQALREEREKRNTLKLVAEAGLKVRGD